MWQRLGFVIGLLLLIAVTPVHAAPDSYPPQGRVYNLMATLTGVAEGATPGDPRGSGTAIVFLDPNMGQVCFIIEVAHIQLPATMAHIHAGAAGVAGPPVLTLLSPDARGIAKSCVPASTTLITAIGMHPSAYYVNVHTIGFPKGAVRGQLVEGLPLPVGLPNTGSSPGPAGALATLALLLLLLGIGTRWHTPRHLARYGRGDSSDLSTAAVSSLRVASSCLTVAGSFGRRKCT